jgi:hypothetical protein
MGEECMKPKFGMDIFGKLALRDMKQNRVFVVTDAGFKPECEVMKDEFGIEHILLIRCHRPGKTFAGDSRSHLSYRDDPASCLQEVDVTNDASIEAWHKKVSAVVEEWMSSPPMVQVQPIQ